MAHFKVSIVLLVAVVACTYAWGGSGRQQQGYEEMGQMGQMSRGFGGGRGSRQALDQGNGQMGQMGQMGGRGSRQYGGEEDARKYVAKLYNDDDVYGYEAKIPAADMLYVNYRNSDARARRGQEFARNFRGGDLGGEGNERSSRMGQNGGGRNQNGGGRSQRGSSNGMGMNMQRQQSQW